MCDNNFGNSYKDISGSPIKDGYFVVDLKKEGTIKSAVNTYNAANPNKPYRFKSYAEYIAYEKAKRKGNCS